MPSSAELLATTPRKIAELGTLKPPFLPSCHSVAVLTPSPDKNIFCRYNWRKNSRTNGVHQAVNKGEKDLGIWRGKAREGEGFYASAAAFMAYAKFALLCITWNRIDVDVISVADVRKVFDAYY